MSFCPGWQNVQRHRKTTNSRDCRRGSCCQEWILDLAHRRTISQTGELSSGRSPHLCCPHSQSQVGGRSWRKRLPPGEGGGPWLLASSQCRQRPEALTARPACGSTPGRDSVNDIFCRLLSLPRRSLFLPCGRRLPLRSPPLPPLAQESQKLPLPTGDSPGVRKRFPIAAAASLHSRMGTLKL